MTRSDRTSRRTLLATVGGAIGGAVAGYGGVVTLVTAGDDGNAPEGDRTTTDEATESSGLLPDVKTETDRTVGDSDADPTDRDHDSGDPPVVDAGVEDPDRNLTVNLTVVTEDREPLADEPVVLQDRGGTPDARFGKTGPRGRLRFVESVGPSPCNRQLLVLPARDRRASLGCNDGGVTVEHVFDLGESSDERDPKDPPVDCDPETAGEETRSGSESSV